MHRHLGAAGELQVGGERQARLAGEQQQVGDRQVVEGEHAVAAAVGCLLDVAAEAPGPVRPDDAHLEHPRGPRRIAVEQPVDPREDHALGARFVEERQPGIGQAGPVEAADHAGRIEHQAQDRRHGGRDRRDGAAGRHHRRRRVRLGVGRVGGGREGDRAVMMEERPQLQVAELDRAGLDRQAEQRPQVDGDDRERRPHHEVALGVADVEARRAQGQRPVPVDLDGAVVQAHAPAGAEPLGDARRHPGLEPGEAHRAARQAQVGEAEADAEEEDGRELEQQDAAEAGPQQRRGAALIRAAQASGVSRAGCGTGSGPGIARPVVTRASPLRAPAVRAPPFDEASGPKREDHAPGA